MNEDDKTYQRPRSQPSGTPSSTLHVTVGSVLKDTYRIDAELGSGGMGTVFLATHLGLDKRMAVKVLSPRAISSPESLARFGREARVAGKVNHPAMTHVIDFGVEQGTPYIVMEYVDGMELAELVERQGPMPPRQAVAVMRQIVSLLHAAHTLGIVHRDLKPANIKVVQAGPDDGQLFVKVLDFGIAKVVGDIAGKLTSEGMMVGTPAYMAPEQITGQPIDGRTDLYAAGLIFHELLGGTRAYQGETIARILHAQVNEPPPPLVLPLPDVVRQTLQKFYEKRPEERFQDAAEADRALAACEEALRSFSPDLAAAAVPLQGGVARTPAVAPESLSGTMKRPASGAAQAEAAEGGFSATMKRPQSGAVGSNPPPVPATPARPVTDRHAAPEQFGKDGRPGPARPATDRQPAPAPPAPMPVLAPAPVPVSGPKKAQPARPSTFGRGFLLGGLAVAFMGCFGIAGLAVLGWQNSLAQSGEEMDPHMPPVEAHPHPEHPEAHPYPEPPEEPPHPQPQALDEAGCYVTDAVFEAEQDDDGQYGPWEFLAFVSRSPVDCAAARKRELSAEARKLAQGWPAPEEVLQVEVLSSAHPDPDDPGVVQKAVRVHTRVSDSTP